MAIGGGRLRGGIAAACAALALPAAAACAAGTPAVGGAHYDGRTSQGRSITIEVASTGRAIGAIAASIVYDGRCGRRLDAPLYQLLSYTEVKLHSGGRFSFTATATAEGSGPQTLKLEISGTFAGRSVAGVLAAVGSGERCAANGYRASFNARAVS